MKKLETQDLELRQAKAKRDLHKEATINDGAENPAALELGRQLDYLSKELVRPVFFSGSLGGESSPPRFYISPPKFGVANDSVIRMCNTTAIFELFPPQHSYPRKNTG